VRKKKQAEKDFRKMDLTETTAAKSDQQNYDDYLGGTTRTVTVTAVTKGSADQPVNLELVEFPGKPYRPNKSMRRVLVLAWGSESDAYVGRQMTLFGDPSVRFGGSSVGGIKISHLSGLDGPLTVALTVTRGKRAPFTVQPLVAPPKPKDESGRDWLKELTATESDMDLISALGAAARTANASDQIIAVIRTEYQRVKDGVTK
jgi:hypothetical protein